MTATNKRKLIEKRAVPTLDTVAYAAGDHMGTLVDLGRVTEEGKTVEVLQVAVLDVDDQGVAFDVLLFDEQPTLTSVDNAAFAMTDAEAAKLVGVCEVASGDYVDVGGQQYAQALPFKFSKTLNQDGESRGRGKGEGHLWLQLVSRGAGTYTASGLTIKVLFRED